MARNEDGILRKKNTGEPGNGGEFGHAQKPDSGLSLTPGHPVQGTAIDPKMLRRLDRLREAGDEAYTIAIKHDVDAAVQECRQVGITSVHLDEWGEDVGAEGCRVGSFSTATEEGLWLDDGTDEQEKALRRFEEIAPTRDIAAALGQTSGATDVTIDCTTSSGYVATPQDLEALVDKSVQNLPIAPPESGRRAQWCAKQAERALYVGTDLRDPDDPEDLGTAVADALANLRHLATQRGLDFDDISQRAARYQQGDLEDDHNHAKEGP